MSESACYGARMKTATRKLLGGLAIVGGVALAAGGVVLLTRKETETPLLGRATETTHSGDMKLTHYRSEMPIEERVGLLQDLTAKSVKDPKMRKLALGITRGCPARDGSCEARAIYNWTKKNIRYTGDVGPHKLSRTGPVEGVDLFQSAARTAEFGGGDCDDHSILNCTLALLNGLHCRFRVTSPSKKRGDNYTHVYAVAGLPKNNPRKWVALDSTLPGRKYGKEAPHAKRRDFVA